MFQSATLVFAGILLQGTALAAFYLRSFGGASVTTLSIVLGVAGVLTIVVVLGSRTARSQIKIFISENFYNYKYDYRVEWTKFIQALSQHHEQGAPDRALRTLTDLLDSQGGVLWMRRPGWRQFVPAASWCFGESWGPVEPDDPILLDLTPRKHRLHRGLETTDRALAAAFSSRLDCRSPAFSRRARRIGRPPASPCSSSARLGRPEPGQPGRHATRSFSRA